MLRPLSEVPFDKLRIGDPVISAIGQNGEITGLIPNDDGTVLIQWAGAQESSCYHHLTDKVMHGTKES